MERKAFGPLVVPSSDLIIGTRLIIARTVAPIGLCFPEADTDCADAWQFFWKRSSMLLMAVNRWIFFCCEVACSTVAIVPFMHRYYVTVPLSLCLLVVHSFRGFLQVGTSWNVAVFALSMAVFRLSYEGSATVFFLGSWVQSASQFFENISMCFHGCHEFLFWRFCEYWITVCNGGICFQSYERHDQRHKRARCQKSLQ